MSETMSFQSQLLMEIKREFPKYRDPKRAEGAFNYMKGIAPFLGIDATTRRNILRRIFKVLPEPTSDQLGKSAIALMKLPQREYHYAAYDLIEYFIEYADETFLDKYAEKLITSTPWWDTVDGLGNAMLSPLTILFPNKKLIEKWNISNDIWLIRSSIQHQRGRRNQTNVPYVLELCQRHVDSEEFFIVKAIGWALRDISKFNKAAVRDFLRKNPELGYVAVREAKRYL
jgi:3-methyladenine DNA glycosylase AlkD